MRAPRIITKHGVRYYSDLFRFAVGHIRKDVRFYVLLTTTDPASALWAKATNYKEIHGYTTAMREKSAQEHLYSMQQD